MKLVVEEPQSAALRDLLENETDQIASAIVEVEVVRAVRRAVPSLVPHAQRVVAQIAVLEPSETIRARAALIEPETLCSLDALHLATAAELGDVLDGLITYDVPMAAAAETLGLAVLAPT